MQSPNVNCYDIFSGEDLKIASRIQKLRLCLLVHSRIYYVLDENIISDNQWSKWGLELAELQAQYPQIARSVCYNEAFIGWDGSSGAFLPLDDEWVVRKASQLLQKKTKPVNIKKSLFSTQIPKIVQNVQKPLPKTKKSSLF